jgi:hypothetical protein
MRRSSHSAAVRNSANLPGRGHLTALSLTVGAQDGKGRNRFGLPFRKPYDV